VAAPERSAFLVARNPDADSSLPYLLHLPVAGGVSLKAREQWPSTARVYCHPLEDWPEKAEVIEEVGVRRCARRGQAIDLVLDRARNNRSQFVFTQPHEGRGGGRPMIFWQTARTAKRARPGQRAPGRRAAHSGRLRIAVDTRERYAYRFKNRPVDTEERALSCGDYAVLHGEVEEGSERLLGVVERKRFEDFVKALVDGSLAFRMAELAAHPACAVVVEERYSALLDAPHVQKGWLCEVAARLQARYPNVPIVFCDSRKLAEDWTYRFLAAAGP